MIRQPRQTCPFCAYVLDAVSCADESRHNAPKPGDVSICVSCGAVLVFDDAMRLRKPSPTESRDLSEDPYVLQVVEAVRRFHAQNPEALR